MTMSGVAADVMPSQQESSLPPSVEDWERLFFQGRHRFDQTVRALRAFYEVMGEEEDADLRAIAARADVGVGTVSRMVNRLRDLGLLEITGGDWDPIDKPTLKYAGSGARRPYRYRPIWPPQ
jgi:hypothetical protein